jgi:hypothetical protein
VQTILLEEGVTVTDLSMTDPLGFDSDETAGFGDFADTFTSPAGDHPMLPTPAHVTPDPTATEPPTVAHVAHNFTNIIIHLQAQVPHDTQRATERALKKHN